MTEEETENLISTIKSHLSDYVDLYKIRVDLFKHLATLSSGSIVVLVTFSKDILEKGSNCFLILALLCLVLSIIGSAWTSFHTLGVMMKTKEFVNGISSFEDLLKVERGNWIAVIPMISFVVSFIFLVIFMIQKI